MKIMAPNPAMTTPELWTRVTDLLRAAEAAHPVMTAPETPQRERDEATDRYVRAVDWMVQDLTELRRRGALAAAGRMLGQLSEVGHV